MSPQLLWTIAGLLLTVLTLGAVSISAFQSTEGTTAKLIAAEVENISTATRMFLLTKTEKGVVDDLFSDQVAPMIPGMAVSGADDLSKFTSKVDPSVSFYVTTNGVPYQYSVTTTFTGSNGIALRDALETTLANKRCSTWIGDPQVAEIAYDCRQQ